jgi:hypothetical protein
MALAKLYSAKSLPSDLQGYGGIGRRTRLRLCEYKSGALVEEYVASYSGGELGGWQYAIRLTNAGHTFYKDHWAYYQDLYPSVQAPEP